MSYFPPLADTAPAICNNQDLFEDLKASLSSPFIPNLFRTLAHDRGLLQSTWSIVKHSLTQGTLPRTIKEMVFVVVAHERSCSYCETAHRALGKHFGVDKNTLDNLLSNLSDIDPENTREVLTFALKVSRQAYQVVDADYQKLENIGLGKSEIMEITGMVSCALYLTNLADALQVPIDDAFYDILNIA